MIRRRRYLFLNYILFRYIFDSFYLCTTCHLLPVYQKHISLLKVGMRVFKKNLKTNHIFFYFTVIPMKLDIII